jgi:hypothetical protein
VPDEGGLPDIPSRFIPNFYLSNEANPRCILDFVLEGVSAHFLFFWGSLFLRGFDAIHLASAVLTRGSLPDDFLLENLRAGRLCLGSIKVIKNSIQFEPRQGDDVLIDLSGPISSKK